MTTCGECPLVSRVFIAFKCKVILLAGKGDCANKQPIISIRSTYFKVTVNWNFTYILLTLMLMERERCGGPKQWCWHYVFSQNIHCNKIHLDYFTCSWNCRWYICDIHRNASPGWEATEVLVKNVALMSSFLDKMDCHVLDNTIQAVRGHIIFFICCFSLLWTHWLQQTSIRWNPLPP